MAKILVYYVDDQAGVLDEASRSDVERYSERINRSGKIECRLIPPPRWSEMRATFDPVPDLFLIDYDLNLVQQNGTLAEYRGSTLAAEIRVRYPDRPIVLITRESILEELDHRKKLAVIKRIKVFDEMLFKSDLDNALGDTLERLVSLSEAYKILAAIEPKNWESLLIALRCDEYNAARLREAAPPLQEGEWITIDASNWIRHTVLEYPGILYDSLYASVHLGITEEVFLGNEVQELFEQARYKGVFSENTQYKRWWRSELFQIAEDLAYSTGTRIESASSFISVLTTRLGRPVEQPKCVWDCQPVADWVCDVLHKPVKLEHTLRYYPDSRPEIMDDARISYRALQNPKNYDPSLLDSKGTQMLREIEDMQDPCERR
jgi:hypothetical protein